MQGVAPERVGSMFKKSAIATAIIIYSPIVMGLFGSMLITSPRFLVLSFYCMGLLLFMFAKISNLAKGKWISFGSNGMTNNIRLLYFTGYALMAISLVISVAILLGK
jgi:hypothetical protein